jgi:hypothetical protein
MHAEEARHDDYDDHDANDVKDVHGFVLSRDA